ncbi:class III poly(R)-hydroxyalkanoic acid synthase subunit PhaE [Luteimonas cellulosilyticus]|nr:class III poly(R)-hydroxyalkanoic acid synthase subunit PhaE [Luteimonas cellulosilyticus]
MSGTELERMARQAWEAWRDALRQTAPGASQAAGFGGLPGAMPGFGEAPADPWRSALDWWARQAPSAGQADVGDTVARFNSQARQWFGQMQQLAAQFAGRDDSAAQITAAWRQALGGLEANPFAKMFDGLQAPGLEGFDAWIARARPLLDAMQGGAHGADWLQLPTFGVAREHQARWQGLAQAMAGYQQSQQAYYALLARASQSAFGLFERKLGAHAAPGQQIESPRVLFDLWIDAAEEAYAEIALSPEFRSAYADLVNGQMRLRLAVQREIEQLCRQFDLPTRTELDGAHRKIAELERHLRRLRDRVDAVAPVVRAGVARGATVTRPHADVRAVSAVGSPRAARTARETSVRSAAVTAAPPPRTTAKSAVPAKKPAAQKTAAKQVPAKKAAAKKAAPNKSAPRKTAKSARQSGRRHPAARRPRPPQRERPPPAPRHER